MINFTVGPVQSDETVRSIGKEQVPYFRTPEFSEVMLENEAMVLEFSKAPNGSRAVFMTCSGTGSMESSIQNVLYKTDKALVVNGGTFGQRFVNLLTVHGIPFDEILIPRGCALSETELNSIDGSLYTCFIVNMHETSTGVLYNMPMISEFCKKYKLLLIVDAISAFLADEFNMEQLGADVVITGSQKAIACPPGISIIVLSPRAISRVERNDPHSLYFDLKSALKDGERGQTPFTPAVGILRQINKRLTMIKEQGGADEEIRKIRERAVYFRKRINDLPFEITSSSMSNAVTPLRPLNTSAYSIFTILKDEYGIWVCPNGGEMKETVFRVGHIGDLSLSDYDELISSLRDMEKRGLI